MAPIGIGIIGTGFGATVHLPTFKTIPDCRVIGIAGNDAAKTQEIATRETIKAYASWQDLIADPEVDAVCVTTPPFLHHEMVLAAAKAGKAILCEKPFGMNVGEATAMHDAAKKAGITAMINFEFREHPVFQHAHQWMMEKRGGPLRHIELRWCVGTWANPARPWQWQCDQKSGGGILGALVVHSLNYLEWLLGPVVRLSAKTGISITERPAADGSMKPVTAPDNCHLLLELQSGATVTCTVSNIDPAPTGHRIEFHGSTKSLILESANMKDYGKGFHLLEGEAGGSHFTELPEGNAHDDLHSDGRIALMKPLAERFVEAVRNKRTDAAPSFAEGVRVQVLLEAIYKANQEKRWVDIPGA